jgi:hypothetical protein
MYCMLLNNYTCFPFWLLFFNYLQLSIISWMPNNVFGWMYMDRWKRTAKVFIVFE